jgi:hypothetical protein
METWRDLSTGRGLEPKYSASCTNRESRESRAQKAARRVNLRLYIRRLAQGRSETELPVEHMSWRRLQRMLKTSKNKSSDGTQINGACLTSRYHSLVAAAVLVIGATLRFLLSSRFPQQSPARLRRTQARSKCCLRDLPTGVQFGR